MCSVDGDKVGWAPPSYLKKCEKSEGESDSDEEYIGLPESCESQVHANTHTHTHTQCPESTMHLAILWYL